MSVSLKFDPGQKFQLDAIAAVVDLFEGQPRTDAASFSLGTHTGTGVWAGTTQTELGFGNALTLPDSRLLANLRRVQNRNGLKPDGMLVPGPAPLNLTVEMETGTGKTYVYLRTMLELYRAYGWCKFVLVVPSVAVREGVAQALRAMKPHFDEVYNHLALDAFVYDGKEPSALAKFSRATTPTVCVMNIQAFNEAEQEIEEMEDDAAKAEKSRLVIHKKQEISGHFRRPIEFIQECRPIVFVDEPQSVLGAWEAGKPEPLGRKSIRRLRPLFCLNYSATHRDAFNQVYNLGPMEARHLRLVKGIRVVSVRENGLPVGGYLKCESIGYGGSGKSKRPEAKLSLLKVDANGRVAIKAEKVKGNKEDLWFLSGENAAYTGLIVDEVDATPGFERVKFNHHGTEIALRPGESLGGEDDAIAKLMVETTVERHLQKEAKISLRAKEAGGDMKVLSLFFLDRVADYRGEEGQPGKVAQWIVEALTRFCKDARYAGLDLWKHETQNLHGGYFAQDRKKGGGTAYKDSATGRTTEADNEAYHLIMEAKEKLLDPAVPLRFIVSHTALREGWDNPNVFQICKLGGANTAVSRRQELGRGLRLPVDSQGRRIREESVNELTVVGAESYNAFAAGLQMELEKECGASFGKVLPRAFAALESKEDEPLGYDGAAKLHRRLHETGFLDADGQIKGNAPWAKLVELLPEDLRPLATEIESILLDHKIERHIKDDKKSKRKITLRKGVLANEAFLALWAKISPRTRYRVAVDTDALVKAAAKELQDHFLVSPTQPRTALIEDAAITAQNKGVLATDARAKTREIRPDAAIPDLIGMLGRRVSLTRATLFHCLKASNTLKHFVVNPESYADTVAKVLSDELNKVLVAGLYYERIEGLAYTMHLIEAEDGREVDAVTERLVEMKKGRKDDEGSPLDPVELDSEVERTFAEGLEGNDDVVCYAKLPRKFKVATPLGNHNPDWAIVKRGVDGKSHLYLVAETKGTERSLGRRGEENLKIVCARKHFGKLDVGYSVVKAMEELPNATNVKG